MVKLETREMPDIHFYPQEEAFLLDNTIMQRLTALTKAQRFKRLSLVLILVTICACILRTMVMPFIAEGRSAWAALNADSMANDTFQANKRPKFPGHIRVKSLDPALLPRSSHDKAGADSRNKRLIFIGDIHGCRDELEALLKKARFDASTDHIVAVGDIVSKGPDSLGVIDLLRRHGASCVRGNHDDRLLLVAQSMRAQALKEGKSSKAGTDSPKSAKLDPVQKMAKSLSKAQFNYLESCPIILQIGELKAFNGEAVVVHAGLVPGVALKSQDPVAAMNMRVVDLATHVPSSKHKLKGSVDWHKLWNRYQQLSSWHERFGISKKGERGIGNYTTVIYGHNAREGLQIHKYTKGLDTGCVRGGKLTALIVNGHGKQEIVQVKAKQHGYLSFPQVDVLRDGGPAALSDSKAD